jgi:hypothetical protein
MSVSAIILVSEQKIILKENSLLFCLFGRLLAFMSHKHCKGLLFSFTGGGRLKNGHNSTNTAF